MSTMNSDCADTRRLITVAGNREFAETCSARSWAPRAVVTSIIYTFTSVSISRACVA